MKLDRCLPLIHGLYRRMWNLQHQTLIADLPA